MRRLTWLPVCAALAIVLAGCSIFYPKHITDVGESADYPLFAAGFERWQIISHAPGARDVSIFYNLCQVAGDEEIEVLALLRTKRITRPQDSAKAVFEAEKAAWLKLQPNAERLNEETVTLSKKGKEYTALKASYLGTGGGSFCFGPRRYFEWPVPRYIELIVWRHEDRILTLHSAATPENRDIASAQNLELLDAVNWTVLPF